MLVNQPNKPNSGHRAPEFVNVHGLLLSFAVLILFTMVCLGYRDWRQYSSVRAVGLRLNAIQTSVEALLWAMWDAEAGQKGYVVTGDARYLEQFNRAVEAATLELATLDKLAKASRSGLDSDLLRLRTQADAQIAEFRESVVGRNQEAGVPGAGLLAGGQEKQGIAEIRRICFDIRRQIASQRNGIQARALAAARGSLLVTTVGSLLLTVLLVAGYLIIKARTTDREEALSGLHALHDLGARLTALSDLHSLLAEILATAEAITSADMGNLQLLDSTGALRIEASDGFSPIFLNYFNEVRGGEAAACGTALARHEQAVIEDVEKSALFAGTQALQVMLDEGVRALQSTPLITRAGNPVGMLSTHYRTPRGPTDRDRHLLSLFAQQAADLIERFRAEEALRESEKQLRATTDQLQLVTDNMAAAVSRCSRDRRYIWVSRGYAEWLRRAPREILGRPIAEVLGQEGYDQIRPYVDRVLSGEKVEYETEVNFLGPGRRWIHAIYVPTRAEDDGVDGWIAVVVDITDERRAAEQMRQNQRLESLGVLAAGIAHDFNNLLGAVLASSSLALDMVGATSPVSELLENVTTAAQRAGGLTRQLLAYAGKEECASRPVDIGSMLKELSALLRASISKNVDLKIDVQPSLPLVLADETQLHQALMNLVINASEAIGESAAGTVEIKACARPLTAEDHAHAIVPLDSSGRPYVAITVSDTGEGMTPAVLARIFDPFFTTKFDGRGLGLSAVLGIVKIHRGGITVRTAPGAGTAITLLFPPAHAAASSDASAAPRRLGCAGAILVVDDEEAIRTVARNTLIHYGHEVLLAENGAQAIDLLAAHPEVTAIVLDVAMPVMSGDQAAPRLRAINPVVPIIVCSGYSEMQAVQKFKTLAGITFLQKPFTAAALAEIVSATTAAWCG